MGRSIWALCHACFLIHRTGPVKVTNGRPLQSPYDNKCDVYAFGVLMWECFHLSCPYSDTGLDMVRIPTAAANVRRMASTCSTCLN